jgi:ribonuclease-3 family protein
MDLSKGMGKEGRDVRLYSPLALAYVGDAVYELMVRSKLVDEKSLPVRLLNEKARDYVSAKAQSASVDFIRQYLTAEEEEIFKNGRNAKGRTVSSDIQISDYKKATGLEALFGYLYMTGDMKRIDELFHLIEENNCKITENNNEEP